MSVMAVIKEAYEHGVRLCLEGDDLMFEAEAEPSAGLLAKLKEHKAEIVALLRQEAAGQATCPTSAPSRSNAVDRAAGHHQRRIAAKEAELAALGLGPDGVTPLDEYRRLAAEGAKAWQNVPPSSQDNRAGLSPAEALLTDALHAGVQIRPIGGK